jgi:hypothetical protein
LILGWLVIGIIIQAPEPLQQLLHGCLSGHAAVNHQTDTAPWLQLERVLIEKFKLNDKRLERAATTADPAI